MILLMNFDILITGEKNLSVVQISIID